MNSEAKPTTSPEQQATTQPASGEKVFTSWQATTLLPSTILGVSILVLPRTISQASGGSGIVVILISGLFPLLVAWALTKVGQQFPGLTFVGYTQKLFTFGGNKRTGRWLAFPFLAGTTLWWVLASALVLRIFAEAQRSVVLPHTPIWFVAGTMLFVSAFVASNKAEVIARMNEFLFPLIVVPMLFIALISLFEVEWTNVLPLFDMTWGQFWKGLLQGIYAYAGISVILMFMASYQQPQQAVKSHAIGIGFVILVYGLITVAGVGVLSERELEQLMWPTLAIAKNIRFPGFIFERIESGFLAIWVVAVFTTLANFLTSAVHLVSEYTGIQHRQKVWVSLPLVVIVYVVALWPSDVFTTFQFGEKVQLFGFLASIIIPVVLLLMALMRRVGNGRDNAGQPDSKSR